MHPPSFGEISEAEAASSELIPDKIPAIDTGFYMENISEEGFLHNNVLKYSSFWCKLGLLLYLWA